ncbi:MAG TPA: glycosyltransferase family protein [Parachlamydiaceae bacterium]|nr:glycosyltransferase family protein [Parachlamydiaceae bacterium]
MVKTKKKRVVIILQARMGSTRLPGKPLKKVLNRPLLSFQVERLRRAQLVDEIIIATTTEPQDDLIVQFCKDEKIAYYRGSALDVLDRYRQAAKNAHADIVVRVTGDCPLIDPEEVDKVIKFYLDHLPEYDYVSNSLERTYPRGLDTEIFSMAMLEEASKEAKLPSEREHVTLYFYTHPESYSLKNVAHSKDLSNYRWTVDTTEDFELITKILETLYPSNPDFKMDDILHLLDKHPEWNLINAHIKQKKL